MIRSLCILLLWAGAVWAEPVGITKDTLSITVETSDGSVEISRNQDTGNKIDEQWALTSRPCPPFCIQPMSPAEGVTTIGELEVLGFLQDPEVLVIDGRIRPEYEAGTIPGAISVPYNEAADRLSELGCEADFDGYDCPDDDPELCFSAMVRGAGSRRLQRAA